MPVEEKYEFEISEEVKEKIEQAENRHALIHENALEDLEPIHLSCKGYLFFKRMMDIVLSFCGLLVLLLPMLIIAIAIFIDDPGKVLFRQYRVGRNGKRFRLYKFRTMKTNTPKYLSTMEVDDPDKYITRLGRFLRKASLDELPHLINVFKGERGIIETTKNNTGFSRVVTVNSISL